jgi:hypothetical protein
VKRVAAAAVAGAVALGMRDVFQPREPVPVVFEHPGDSPELEPITLFFHPEVPEATLVLVLT